MVEEDWLVKPTGKQNDRLGVLLHYPTFSTRMDNWKLGDTYDMSSPCPRYLGNGKGVPKDDVLWLDTFARRADIDPALRKAGKDPMDIWSTELQACHTQWSTGTMESSRCKVWVVCGASNERRLKAKYSRRLAHFQVSFQGAKIFCSFHLGSDGAMLRLIIWTYHPEFLARSQIYAPRGWCMSAADAAWNLAGALTGIPLRPSFFGRRLARGVREDDSIVIEDQGYVIEDQGSVLEDQGSVLEDQGSVPEDQGSAIEDQGSEIRSVITFIYPDGMDDWLDQALLTEEQTGNSCEYDDVHPAALDYLSLYGLTSREDVEGLIDPTTDAGLLQAIVAWKDGFFRCRRALEAIMHMALREIRTSNAKVYGYDDLHPRIILSKRMATAGLSSRRDFEALASPNEGRSLIIGLLRQVQIKTRTIKSPGQGRGPVWPDEDPYVVVRCTHCWDPRSDWVDANPHFSTTDGCYIAPSFRSYRCVVCGTGSTLRNSVKKIAYYCVGVDDTDESKLAFASDVAVNISGADHTLCERDVVRVKCADCGRQKDDLTARYHRPSGRYVAKQSSCFDCEFQKAPSPTSRLRANRWLPVFTPVDDRVEYCTLTEIQAVRGGRFRFCYGWNSYMNMWCNTLFWKAWTQTGAAKRFHQSECGCEDDTRHPWYWLRVSEHDY